MDNIIIRNKKFEKRFKKLLDECSSLISQDNLNFIKIIILRFKKNSNNEYFIVLALIYWLVYFKALKYDDSRITDEDRAYLDKIYLSYLADVWGDKEKYLEYMIEMEDDLFLLKMVIKYTLLNTPEFLEKVIPNLENYYKSIWYIIPLMTLKESNFLLFFQDFYFKKLYPVEYLRIKKYHLKQTSQSELPWEYIISTINSLNQILFKAGVEWVFKMRKKSYFSLFSKYNKNEMAPVMDSIGIRIIFRDLKNLNKFINIFESDFVFLKKKDYITTPKKSWYRSIHYTFINPFRSAEILVELQLRTKKMNRDINENNLLSHFNYTIFEHKWDPLFQEVHTGYQIMKKYIDKTIK